MATELATFLLLWHNGQQNQIKELYVGDRIRESSVHSDGKHTAIVGEGGDIQKQGLSLYAAL